MPIRESERARYPKDWSEISKRIRFERAQNHCEVCGCENYKPHPITGSKVVLTVMHLNHIPEDVRDENLKAACQRCHLRYDAKRHAETRRKTRNVNQRILF